VARANAFSLKVDVSEIENFATRLADLTPEKVGALLVDALNETADSAYELSRKAILSGINLTDSYVKSQMKVEHATAQSRTATIVAFGGKGHTTGLSHYGAIQEVKKVTWSNERIQSLGHEFEDKWPGWIRRKGDTARGIQVGDKTAGVSVKVTTSRKQLKTGKAIIMPGVTDREGNPVVFKRVGGSGRQYSKLKALQGPSVYQLFRVAGEAIQEQVYGDLEKAVVDSAERQFLKEFS
jgi:hypothetical protein